MLLCSSLGSEVFDSLNGKYIFVVVLLIYMGSKLEAKAYIDYNKQNQRSTKRFLFGK